MSEEHCTKLWERVFLFISFGSVIAAFIFALCTCYSCTTSVTTIYSTGESADNVDEDQTASPTISPKLR